MVLLLGLWFLFLSFLSLFESKGRLLFWGTWCLWPVPSSIGKLSLFGSYLSRFYSLNRALNLRKKEGACDALGFLFRFEFFSSPLPS